MSSRAKRVVQPTEPYAWDVPPRDWDVPARALAVSPSPRASADSTEPAAPDDQHMPHLAALERDAFGKGYAQGERAGGEAAGARADAMVRRLAQTVEELASLRNDVLRRTERQVVQLALAIASRILERELSVDRGLLLAMARVALDRLGEHAAATIRLHPDDFAVVMAARGAEPLSEQVQVVADPVVGRGGCLVQSDFGLMDVGIESQFRELARMLLDGHDGETMSDPVHALHAVAVRA
jgi:flagellar assembly protein FliH